MKRLAGKDAVCFCTMNQHRYSVRIGKEIKEEQEESDGNMQGPKRKKLKIPMKNADFIFLIFYNKF